MSQLSACDITCWHSSSCLLKWDAVCVNCTWCGQNMAMGSIIRSVDHTDSKHWTHTPLSFHSDDGWHHTLNDDGQEFWFQKSRQWQEYSNYTLSLKAITDRHWQQSEFKGKNEIKRRTLTKMFTVRNYQRWHNCLYPRIYGVFAKWNIRGSISKASLCDSEQCCASFRAVIWDGSWGKPMNQSGLHVYRADTFAL